MISNDNHVYIKFRHKKYKTMILQPIFKKWDEVTRKMVRDDPDEKMGPVVPDEMTWYEMVLARQVPEPFVRHVVVLQQLFNCRMTAIKQAAHKMLLLK